MTNHSFTFASGAPTRSRSSAAYVAVAAVGIISGTLVTLQLSAPPAAGAAAVMAAPIVQTAQAATPSAKTWDLEARWWGGETRHAEQPAAPSTTASAASSTAPAHPVAASVPESELTFTKGYALRLAARKAAGQVAEGKTGVMRPAVVARTAPARTAASVPRSLAAPTRSEPAIEPPAASDAGSQTLAFDEPRGFGAPRAAAFPSLFGRLY